MVGNFANVKNAEEEAQINHLARWYKPWFYKHVESFLTKGPTTEFIPLREYLLRHNRAIFWVVEAMIPFGNNPLFRLYLQMMVICNTSSLQNFLYLGCYLDGCYHLNQPF